MTSRELWLRESVKLLKPRIQDLKFVFPDDDKWSISVGFPVVGLKAIGECWMPQASKDGVHQQIFISPVLEDPVEVLGVVLHEMLHAALPPTEGHGLVFTFAVRTLGLKGLPTATFVGPNTKLFDDLSELAMQLGPFPHIPLDPKLRPKKKKSKAKREPKWGTLKSVKYPEYQVKVLLETVDRGLPTDPWGETMIWKDQPVEESEEEASDE